jgi:small-conductance mechanosensitive channel
MQAAVSDPSALAQAIKGMNAVPSPTSALARAGSAGLRTPPSKRPATGPQPIPDATSLTVATTAGDDAAAAKIAELTQLLEAQAQAAEQAQKDQERTAAQNEKLRGVLGQYRERWEALKTEARKRRNGAKATGTTTPIEEGVETSEGGEDGEGGGEEKEDKADKVEKVVGVTKE